MIKTFTLSFLIVALGLFYTGCAKKEAPSPADTVMGGGAGGANTGMIPSDVYQGDLAALGLQVRGGDGGRSWDADANGLPPAEDRVETIYFNFDDFSILPAERQKLQIAADFFRDNPNRRILCVGFTDWIGTDEYNLVLGDRRASSVKTYLINLGIDPARIEVLSRGELDAVQNLPRDDPRVIRDRRTEVYSIR